MIQEGITMINVYQQTKVNRFISKLQKSIDVYNQSEQGFRLEVSDIKDTWDNQNSRMKHNLKVEAELTEKAYTYFYSLSKNITLPYSIDVSNMTIEKIEIDSEALKAYLKSDKISRYGLVKSRNTTITHPTIFATKGRATVTGGFELDFIYPVVKQNNSNTSITDEELNKLIRNDKPFVNFVDGAQSNQSLKSAVS